ncbi:hypothetical protein QBC47DRAFT_68749 [Echria macrotheca]|uniref:C2H2-type domain-containing protein n=1 Tax=Echria macrotheca TaxID=438768 RepID=A0AAJ0B8R2_9PEZI|nr:hypothetical protein QBC47DRAFT_68749 [Echria macrotheca]
MDPDGGDFANWVSSLEVDWTLSFLDDSIPGLPLEIDNTLGVPVPDDQEWGGVPQTVFMEGPHETDPFLLSGGLLGDLDPLSAYPTWGQEMGTQSPSTFEFSFSSPSPPGVNPFSPTIWESPITPDTPMESCEPITWSEFRHPQQSTTQLLSPACSPEEETLQNTAPHHIPGASKPKSRNRRTRDRKASRSNLPAKEQRKKDLPEVCECCGKGFQYRAGLKRHIQSHHHEILAPENIPCPLCGKRYKRTDHLYRHGKKHHGWPPNPKSRRRPAAGTRRDTAV